MHSDFLKQECWRQFSLPKTKIIYYYSYSQKNVGSFYVIQAFSSVQDKPWRQSVLAEACE